MTNDSWWGSDGPWKGEPRGKDFHHWRDPDTGYRCAIRRNPMGAWCGYAEIPDSIETDYFDGNVELECHDGITFAHDRLPDGSTEAKRGFQWVGFDCAHWNDLVPGLISPDRAAFLETVNLVLDAPEVAAVPGLTAPGVYRTYVYALNEIRNLCASAKKALGNARLREQERGATTD